MNNFRKIIAIQKTNEERWLKVNPSIPHKSGIYVMFRNEVINNVNVTFAYVGQAKDLLYRLGQHLSGQVQHIDKSLKKHKLFNTENPTGWNVKVYEFPIEQLDEKEQFYISKCLEHGYQLRNKTAGGQCVGKTQIDEYRPTKTYRDGIKQGETNIKKDVRNYFDKYLDVSTKKENKLCERKLQEFKENYLGENNNEKI